MDHNRSMDNKEKLYKKYVNQKMFLIKTPMETINQGQNDIKRTWKKIILINFNKRFTTFPTMIKHEKH